MESNITKPIDSKEVDEMSRLAGECTGMIQQYLVQVVISNEADLPKELESILAGGDISKLRYFHARLVGLVNPAISEPSSGYR